MFRDAPYYTSLRYRAVRNDYDQWGAYSYHGIDNNLDYAQYAEQYNDETIKEEPEAKVSYDKNDRLFKVFKYICVPFILVYCSLLIYTCYYRDSRGNRLIYKVGENNLVLEVALPNRTQDLSRVDDFKTFVIENDDLDGSLRNYGAHTLLYPTYSMLPPFTLDTEGGYSPKLWANTETHRAFSPLTSHNLTGILAVIPDGVYGPDSNCNRDSTIGGYSKLPVGSSALHVRYLFPLLDEQKCTYEHFITELLPRIAQASDFIKIHNLTLLMRKGCDYHAFNILKMLNLGKYILIENDDSVYYVSDYLVHSCVTPLMHPFLWSKTRALLNINEAPLQRRRSQPPRVLFALALRKKAFSPIINDMPVIKILNQRFQDVTVFRGSQDFNQVVQAFANSDIIISAAREPVLSNIIFAPVNSHVIELFPTLLDGKYVVREQKKANVIWRLARTLGHKYYRVFESPSNKHGEFKASPKNLDEIIDIVLQHYYSESALKT